ncbi:hypothetical protein HIM_01504 [Hirsutella minnesotensis 3608]|nr:hypothetical protein HIM_01504 [Hirsutella minnesotensis 3608]
MEAIERLLEWAIARGVKLDGIEPKPLPGRGIGIVATRAIKAGEDILTVPCSLLRSLGNTPKPILRKLKGATVHAILSASLCLDDGPDLDICRAVYPTKADFEATMPICWPAEAQELLPATARRLLTKQLAKLDRDWAVVSAAYPDAVTRDDFVYAWNLVNSRTFYHTTPQTAKRLPKDDHMVLQPVADLFNHAPDGCSVAFDQADYTFTTRRAYAPGDELFICYGAHSNDFLLVEYGFSLGADNPWDETCLDPYLCPLFSRAQRAHLDEAGFWERYMLDAQTACYRTQVALRMLCLSSADWAAFLDGSRDEDQDQAAADAELRKILRRYEKDIRSKIAQVDRASEADELAKVSLRARWVQIKELVTDTMSRIQR